MNLLYISLTGGKKTDLEGELFCSSDLPERADRLDGASRRRICRKHDFHPKVDDQRGFIKSVSSYLWCHDGHVH